MQKFIKWMEPDKYYHVFNRACGFDKLFITKGNYIYFLKLYTRFLDEFVETYAYCLLPNHFHFLIKPKDLQGFKDLGGLYSNQFSKLFNSYARSFNKMNGRNGSLFSQNFKRKEIASMDYMRGVVIYIHRNPIKHGYIESIEEWSHFSYSKILNGKKDTINVRTDEVLEWFGGKDNFKNYHSLEISIDLE